MRFFQILNGERFTIKKAWKGSNNMTKGKAAKSRIVVTHSHTFSMEASTTNNESMFQTFLGTQMYRSSTCKKLECSTNVKKSGFFIFTTQNCQSANRQNKSI
jgi:L-fucose isomerase-like protein